MQSILELPKVKKLNKEFSPNPLVPKDFDFIAEIGRGAFGKVYKVYSKQKNSFFALKVLNQKQITKLKLWSQLLKEVEILSICDHSNVIKLFSVFNDLTRIYLLLELANGNSLFSELQKKKKLNESRTSEIIKDVLKALDYLHSLNPPVLHRDLKPENILIHNKKIKIADFGWSNQKDNFRNTFCGTPDYLSPEMIRGTGHNEKLDIWTVGVLMYELLHGKPPFSPKYVIRDPILQQRKIEDNVLKGVYSVDQNIGLAAKKVLELALKPDQKLRPSARDLIDFEFFNNFDKSNILYKSHNTLKGFLGIVKNFSKSPKYKKEKFYGKLNNSPRPGFVSNDYKSNKKKFFKSEKNIVTPSLLNNYQILKKSPKPKKMSKSPTSKNIKKSLKPKKISKSPFSKNIKKSPSSNMISKSPKCLKKNNSKKPKKSPNYKIHKSPHLRKLRISQNLKIKDKSQSYKKLIKSQKTLKFFNSNNNLISLSGNESPLRKKKSKRDYESEIENLKLTKNNYRTKLKITEEILKKEEDEKNKIKNENTDLRNRIKYLELNLLKKNEMISNLKKNQKNIYDNNDYFLKQNLEEKKKLNIFLYISNKINNFYDNNIKKNSTNNNFLDIKNFNSNSSIENSLNNDLLLNEKLSNNFIKNEDLKNYSFKDNEILYKLEKIFQDFLKKNLKTEKSKILHNNLSSKKNSGKLMSYFILEKKTFLNKSRSRNKKNYKIFDSRKNTPVKTYKL